MPHIEPSAASIGAIHPSSIPQNFQFADQHGQVYPCNVVLAQLLSPRVVQLLSTDPTIDCLEIEVGNGEDFSVFVSLLERGTAEFSDKCLGSCIGLAQQLGNSELANQFLALHPHPTELTTRNILGEFTFFESVNAPPPSELLQFARTHFYQLAEVFAGQLKPETLDLIFSQSLVLESEDAFFDFVKGEIEVGSIDLLQHVDLRYLSSSKVDEFLALLDLTTLTAGIWDRIKSALRSIRADAPCRSSAARDRSWKMDFYSGRGYFDGIFAYLNRFWGGNCARNGIIEATSLKEAAGDLSVLFAASDWSDGNHWRASSTPNVWFKVDFKTRKVSVTHYAIHDCLTRNRDDETLKTWALEGSNSELNSDSAWTVIDSRRDDESLRGKEKLEALFECNGDTSQAFRYIRLIQRGPCHGVTAYDFSLSQFEIFGVLSATD
jgi:hypothetical protein